MTSSSVSLSTDTPLTYSFTFIRSHSLSLFIEGHCLHDNFRDGDTLSLTDIIAAPNCPHLEVSL